MINKTQAPPLRQRDFLSWLMSAGVAFLWLLLIFSVSNAQAATRAGTQISNSAAATYLDSAGIERNVTSNTVITEVQQVASVTLDQDLAYTVNPGGEVAYPVTLTNSGNGSDSFALAATSNTGGFILGSVVFYADSNGDGIADNNIPITSTPALAPGEVFYFVVSATAPVTATTGQANTLVVKGTSAFNTGVSDSVAEIATITDNAVVNVTKAMSATTGPSPSAPTTYTVALSYRNEGNKTATAVKLVDMLPTGMKYVAGSGRWSVTGTTALTDVTSDIQGTSPTIDYSVASGTVTGIVNSIAVGQAGTLTFRVEIDSGVNPGILPNTATYEYNDGVTTLLAKNTNTVNFTVTPSADVAFVGPSPVASAPEGSTIAFDNVLTNKGNATDTFDVTIASNTFPAGSSYVLYRPGGLVPLVDSNSNGVPDTGPVAAGATYTVVLKVTLPTNVNTVTTPGPFIITKTATSTNDPTQTATATDTLTTVSQNSVDLTNNTALTAGVDLGKGVFASGEAAPVVTNTALPGTAARFTLYANNTGPTADSYNLAASTDNTFGTLVLPTGWTVVYRDGVTNAVISNTGLLAPGANRLIYADVTIPAGQAATAAAGQSIYFRVLSPTTLSQDIIHDAVKIDPARSLSLIAPNTGQIEPGATRIYGHKLTNTGNVAEDIALTLGSTAGFTSSVYIDVNNDGVIDAGDTLVNTADALADVTALAPGGIVNLLVKVMASANTSVGAVDTTTLTATSTNDNTVVVKVIDATTVISGSVVLFKEQALDAACDGSADGAFSASVLNTGAVPGACIVYRITATNNGTADVTSLVISDNTPAYTKYDNSSPAATTLGAVTTVPANATTGAISANIATLTPSASAVLTFGVKID